MRGCDVDDMVDMSSTSHPHILVDHSYATDKYIPSMGEVIVVCLSQGLPGPGPTLGSARDLPSHATCHNYHRAVVIDITMDVYESIFMNVTALPMPAYSAHRSSFWTTLYELAI
jgi:hypothetical protein